MGSTTVNATLIGEKMSKDYQFLVDAGATHVGLPAEEIDRLGLAPIPNGRIRVLTATGVVEQETYSAHGNVQGRGFAKMVTQAPMPIIGCELLESVRLKVDPVTQELEGVDDDLAPPYLL